MLIVDTASITESFPILPSIKKYHPNLPSRVIMNMLVFETASIILAQSTIYHKISAPMIIKLLIDKTTSITESLANIPSITKSQPNLPSPVIPIFLIVGTDYTNFAQYTIYHKTPSPFIT